MVEGVEVRWSRKAIRQIKKIGELISIDSPWQAERVVRQLFAAPERIAWSPAKGRIVPEYQDPALREISIHSWRVIYRLRQSGLVEIVAVVHGRRILTDDLLDGGR